MESFGEARSDRRFCRQVDRQGHRGRYVERIRDPSEPSDWISFGGREQALLNRRSYRNCLELLRHRREGSLVQRPLPVASEKIFDRHNVTNIHREVIGQHPVKARPCLTTT